MPLPTLSKTWVISPNNSLPTNGTSNTDSIGRQKDIADFLGTVVTQLIALSGGLVTCVGSSDGVTNVSSPTLNATNLWTSGSTDFRNGVQGVFNGSGSIVNTPWVVLDFPEGQLMMCFHQSASVFVVGWSETKVYVAPASATNRPTAVDEAVLQVWTSTYYTNLGMWNQDTLGITNSANSYSSYTQQVQVGLTSDALGFYAVSFRANVPAFVIWFGKLQSPIVGTLPGSYDWTDAYVMMMSGNQNVRQVCGPQYDASGYQPRASYDTNAARFVVPCIASGNTSTFSGNYDSWPGNAYQYSGSADADTGTYTLAPIGLYSPTRSGIKGVLTDLWWGPGGGSTYTYPASAPLAPEFFQANDLVFPWDATTTILFS